MMLVFDILQLHWLFQNSNAPACLDLRKSGPRHTINVIGIVMSTIKWPDIGSSILNFRCFSQRSSEIYLFPNTYSLLFPIQFLIFTKAEKNSGKLENAREYSPGWENTHPISHNEENKAIDEKWRPWREPWIKSDREVRQTTNQWQRVRRGSTPSRPGACVWENSSLPFPSLNT